MFTLASTIFSLTRFCHERDLHNSPTLANIEKSERSLKAFDGFLQEYRLAGASSLPGGPRFLPRICHIRFSDRALDRSASADASATAYRTSSPAMQKEHENLHDRVKACLTDDPNRPLAAVRGNVPLQVCTCYSASIECVIGEPRQAIVFHLIHSATSFMKEGNSALVVAMSDAVGLFQA